TPPSGPPAAHPPAAPPVGTPPSGPPAAHPPAAPPVGTPSFSLNNLSNKPQSIAQVSESAVQDELMNSLKSLKEMLKGK
ncbi:MAG: hypothetical protein ACTSRS_12365, partial [Candidatus Helarchaeota archaeon]